MSDAEDSQITLLDRVSPRMLRTQSLRHRATSPSFRAGLPVGESENGNGQSDSTAPVRRTAAADGSAEGGDPLHTHRDSPAALRRVRISGEDRGSVEVEAADGLEEYFLVEHHFDDDRGGSLAAEIASRRRHRSSTRLIAESVNLGAAALIACLVLGAIGVGLRYGVEGETSREAGRFMLAGSLFGLVVGASNIVATKVLLRTLFLSKNEEALQASIRDVIMGVFFCSQAHVSTEVNAHVRRVLSTMQLPQLVHRVALDPAVVEFIDLKIDAFARSPEGLTLAFMGVTPLHLRDALVPGILQTIGELAPVLSEVCSLGDFVNGEQVFALLQRLVTTRAEELSVKDVRHIVSAVLGPHLSLLVLWGCVLGVVIGVLTEVFTLSKFLSGCREFK